MFLSGSHQWQEVDLEAGITVMGRGVEAHQNFVGEEGLKIQVPRRRSRKNQKRYESDSDSQIALRLARLRRDVLELQEESEEEILEEHKEDDDALIRLRSFRESLGILMLNPSCFVLQKLKEIITTAPSGYKVPSEEGV